MSGRADLAGGWFLKPHGAPCPLAGWCVLELARPCATLDALTVDESRSMGEHVRGVSASIRAVTGCARVYLLAFAEAHRQVHLHLVPRHEADEASKGWSLADLYREVAAGRRTAAAAAEVEAAFAAIVRRVAPSRD